MKTRIINEHRTMNKPDDQGSEGNACRKSACGSIHIWTPPVLQGKNVQRVRSKVEEPKAGFAAQGGFYLFYFFDTF
jgi:hypothetical protein